jgi:hypothetical protein
MFLHMRAIVTQTQTAPGRREERSERPGVSSVGQAPVHYATAIVEPRGPGALWPGV